MICASVRQLAASYGPMEESCQAVPKSGRKKFHPSALSPSRAGSEQSGFRFNAEAVVHGSTDSLLAAEITFGCLHRNMSEKELNLVQFSPGGMAQLSA